jgi:hypothetical protein
MESAGGHAVVAGVQAGGHPVAISRDPVAQSVPKSPSTGLVGGGRWALVGPLASDMSEAAPSPLKAALINSRLVLMASPASLASRVASVAMSAAWPTIRLLLTAIISFFEFPRCLANPRSVVSSGS